MPERFNTNEWRIHEIKSYVADLAEDVESLAPEHVSLLGDVMADLVTTWRLAIRSVVSRYADEPMPPVAVQDYDITDATADALQGPAEPYMAIVERNGSTDAMDEPLLECPVCASSQRMHIATDEQGQVPAGIPRIGCGNPWHYYIT